MMERYLSPEERAQIEKLGFDKLMETLRQRLAEQKGRHQGGSKWIGTGGTSPFGAYGDNPEGVRIGQDKGRRGSAVKVWDKREFKDFDGDAELGPRNISWRCDGFGDLPARAWRKSSISTAPSGRPRTKAISTFSSGPNAATPSRCCCFSMSAARWIGTSKRGAAFLRGEKPVQAPRPFLLPQLPLRECVEEQPPPARRARADARSHQFVPTRLSRRVCRRRLIEPLRDHGSRRLGRASQSGAREGVARARNSCLAAQCVDQSDAAERLGSFAVDNDDRRNLSASHVSADLRRGRSGDAGAGHLTLAPYQAAPRVIPSPPAPNIAHGARSSWRSSPRGNPP